MAARRQSSDEAADREVTADDVEFVARVGQWLDGFPIERPLVVVTIYNAYEDVVECIASLRATTAPDVPLLLIDDASPDRRMEHVLAPIAERDRFLYLRKPKNRGIVDSANFAFVAGGERDVVILNSDIVLPQGWLERLRAAAYSRPNVATVTPLTNNGVLYSVPYRNQPIGHLMNGMTTDQMDALIREASAKARPIVPTAITFCTFFRRAALDVLGVYDEIFSPGYGEEVDFSQRATISGFVNLIADDLFVFHKGSRSFGNNERKRRIQDDHEEIIAQRYPWHMPMVQDAERNMADPLCTVIDRARIRVLGMRLAIDATCINNEHVTGTQVGTLGLARALAERRERDYPITLIVNDDLRMAALGGVDRLVDAVKTVSQVNEAGDFPFDIVHRPFQVNRHDELFNLNRWGWRFIISHLDCIGYANPKYARNAEEWLRFRELTRQVFHLADGIAFISQGAADDAAQRGLTVPYDRSDVIYFGTDHHEETVPQAPRKAQFAERPFLLLLGTNFLHKNRSFGIAVLHELVMRYRWSGNLVFAGPQVSDGGSAHVEARAKLAHCEVAGRIFDLGNVTDAQKVWLLGQASLVIYPSIYEGFGIVPFEAAACGTPAIAARFSPMEEVLGPDVQYFGSLDAAREAARVWTLLSEPEAIARQVAAINARAERHTWAKVAERADALYARIAAKPSRSKTALELSAHYDRKLHEHHAHLTREYARLETWAADLERELLRHQDLLRQQEGRGRGRRVR